MRKLDIVYILKEDIDPSELIYSLRSVDQFFPHRKVWFVCGQPEGLVPDGRIVHHQEGATKWLRARQSFEMVAKCEDITEDFYLFNDDFFVLKPIRGEFINWSNGTLEKRIRDIEMKYGRQTKYSREMMRMRVELVTRRFDTISFSVHVPMLMNRKKLAEVLEKFDTPMLRSIYGNVCEVPYIYHEDVKIYDMTTLPDPEWTFVSTQENTFSDGKVGEFIRTKFREPSRFEKQKTVDVHEHYTEEGDMI